MDELGLLLPELEARLRGLGAACAAAFRPGAAPGLVRERLAAEGLEPHPDLVAWWAWHDGVETDPPPLESGPGIYHRAETVLLGPWHLLSLADSLRIRRWLREQYDAAGIGFLMPHGWTPVLTTDGAEELCANTAATGPAPLHLLGEGRLEPSLPHLASLAALVSTLLEVIDDGLVVPDAHLPGAFRLDDARLAGERRRLVVW